MDSKLFNDVRQFLSIHSGAHIEPGYTSLRGLSRYAKRRGFGGVRAYLAYVRDHREELPNLYNHALVHTTRFARDRQFWRHLLRDVLAARGWYPGPLRIVSLGCADGAEVATIAALARQHVNELEELFIDVWDIAPLCAARAQDPHTNRQNLKRLEPLTVPAFEDAEGRKILLRPELRECICSHVGDVRDGHWYLNRPKPYLVLCRNLLVYFDKPTVAKLYEGLAEALLPGGFLGIGPHDPLPPAHQFTCVAPMLYRRTSL